MTAEEVINTGGTHAVASALFFDAPGAGTVSTGGVQWLVSDHLGTPRMVADLTGSLAGIKRHDYLPFGEELYAGTGGRTTNQGYSQPNTLNTLRERWATYERDDETGLDYAQARYYSSAQGRFTSPDEFKSGPRELWVLGSGDPEKQALYYAEVTNPQSLNKYQYCFNNPLRYIDPDGQNPQDSFEIKMQQAIRDVNSGAITPEQYWDRLRGPGIGTAAGLAVLLAAKGGRSILTPLSIWAGQNPDKVQQIAQGILEAGGGAPGILTLAPYSRLRPAEISTGMRLAKQLGVGLKESVHPGADYIVTGTNIAIDAVGTPDAYKHWSKDGGAKLLNSIVEHFTRKTGLDHIAIDLSGASKGQIKAIEKTVAGLTKEQQQKVIYVR